MHKKLLKHWQLLFYSVLAVMIRFWNFPQTLYFIYDQGRDALVLQKMAQGDLVIIGPTTGLGGFFLGPLWYYVGLPGYLLSGGNPYGICLWYIAIACLSLPVMWWLAHRLFQDKIWALVCAVLLAIIPGSLQAAQIIWNPLLSVPLMLGMVYCFAKVRESAQPQRWLWLGFLCLGLTLQSEFAYAVFFLPVFFVLIPWLRQKFRFTDFLGAIGVVLLTGAPQLLFEVRHRFGMTTSLLQSLLDPTQRVSFERIWQQRPQQLIASFFEQILAPGDFLPILTPLLLGTCVFGVASVVWQSLTTSGEQRKKLFLWQLIAICTVLPYPFFFLWRGNNGNFFSYYLTSHFIFLLPMILYGLKSGLASAKKIPLLTPPFAVLATLFNMIIIGAIFSYSAKYWKNIYLTPQNNGGLTNALRAVSQVYAWQQQDQLKPGAVRIFTSNILTEQYDYLFDWYARAHARKKPQTVRVADDTTWYILLEGKAQVRPAIFDPWYQEATASGRLTREQQVGILTLETWSK